MTAISFHATLHGFWMGQGTGTAVLEANLLQQLAAMREAVLFKVFLDLWKAYNDLDRERALDLFNCTGSVPGRFEFFGRTGTD